MQAAADLEVANAVVGTLHISVMLAGPSMTVRMADVDVFVRPLAVNVSAAHSEHQTAHPAAHQASDENATAANSSAPAQAAGLLGSMQERAAAAAAAIDKLLNSAGVRIDRLQLHVALPARHNAASAATAAALHTGSEQRGSAEDAGSAPACVCCRIASAKFVDATDWQAWQAAREGEHSRQLDKTLEWEGLTLSVCQHCTCEAAADALQQASGGAGHGSAAVDEVFHDCEEPIADPADGAEVASSDIDSASSTCVLSGSGGAGFSGRASVHATLQASGKPKHLSISVSTATGASGSVTADALPPVLTVVARAHAHVARVLARGTQARAVPLTASVLASIGPVDPAAEVAALVHEEADMCACHSTHAVEQCAQCAMLLPRRNEHPSAAQIRVPAEKQDTCSTHNHVLQACRHARHRLASSCACFFGQLG